MKDTKVEQLEKKLKFELEKFDYLKKSVECPVCFVVPRKGPIFTCPNGHLLCQKCKTESCPTCREAMGDNKSLLAVAVIENILHDCKFVNCEEKLSLNQIGEHEKVCKHRVVSCPYYLKCVESVPLSKLTAHLETKTDCCFNKTPAVINGYGISTVSQYRFDPLESKTLEERLVAPQLYWRVRTYCFEGHFFALTVNKSGDYWKFVIVMFESLEVCSEYNIEMQVYETGSSPEKRLSAKACCRPCSIDQTVDEKEGFGLIVHHKFMKEMMLKEDRFRFTVSFSFF